MFGAASGPQCKKLMIETRRSPKIIRNPARTGIGTAQSETQSADPVHTAKPAC